MLDVLVKDSTQVWLLLIMNIIIIINQNLFLVLLIVRNRIYIVNC
jgi:hypothetical protein